MKELNYFEDLEIDESNLNKIVDTHAITAMRYQELFIEKMDELNEQKRKIKIEESELKEVYAQLYLQNKKSGEKVTEKENESLILINEKYKQKQKKYFDEIKNLNDIEKSFNILEGVVKTMQARKNMIEEKIKLIQLGFSSIKQNVANKIDNKLNK